MNINVDIIKNKIITMDNIITNNNISSLKFNHNFDIPSPSPERLLFLQNQVIKLSNINQPVQRSDDWYKMRENKLTASDWATALNKNPYSTRKNLLRSKCGEKTNFFGGHMKHGVKYEPVANLIYEFRNKLKIIDFGLLPHPTIDFLGASPDGITTDGVMVEIKCPPKREITGDPPLYYWMQVQGQLEVCELDRCDFLECKIEEYTEDEYFNDNFVDDKFYNNLGMEKGIVIVFMRKSDTELVFEYSKLGINKADFLLWTDEVKNCKLLDTNLIFVEYTFWKLTKISCVPIYRDQSWFKSILPDLQKFWDDVLHYRKIGTTELQPKPRKKKNSNELFIDTHIEDFQNNSESYNTIINYNDKSKFKNVCLFDHDIVHNIDNIDNNDNKCDKLVKIKPKTKIEQHIKQKICLFSDNN